MECNLYWPSRKPVLDCAWHTQCLSTKKTSFSTQRLSIVNNLLAKGSATPSFLFSWVLGIWTQAFMLMPQLSYPLNRLFSLLWLFNIHVLSSPNVMLSLRYQCDWILRHLRDTPLGRMWWRHSQGLITRGKNACPECVHWLGSWPEKKGEASWVLEFFNTGIAGMLLLLCLHHLFATPLNCEI